MGLFQWSDADFNRPGKPQDNTLIEAFNNWLRQECLNEHWFLTVADAQEKAEAWRQHYNRERPHGALGNIAPEAFVRQASALGSCLDLAQQELVVVS